MTESTLCFLLTSPSVAPVTAIKSGPIFAPAGNFENLVVQLFDDQLQWSGGKVGKNILVESIKLDVDNETKFTTSLNDYRIEGENNGNLALPQALVKEIKVWDTLAYITLTVVEEIIYPETLKSTDDIDSYSNKNVVFLFPNKLKSGDRPKELWANRDFLIAASPYWKMMFDSEFMEAKAAIEISPLSPAVYSTSSNSYCKNSGPSTSKSAGKVAITDGSSEGAVLAKENQKVGMEVDEAGTDAHYDPFSDSDAENELPQSSAKLQPIHKIIVQETSHRTYRAVLYYLHHNKVFFSQISSHKGTKIKGIPAAPPATTLKATPIQKTLTCSPKSVYRLAYQLSLAPLQALALESYSSQLNSENVIYELFSEFSLCYEEIQKAAWYIAKMNWVEVAQTKSMKWLKEGLESGEIDGRKAALLVRLMKDMRA